jgi:dTDP-4-amino-4,6-dideoxygalactose transaminase
MNPHQVTKDFEAALCEYTGAKYAVAVTSCTMALLLVLKYHFSEDTFIADQRLDIDAKPEVRIPKRTYVSVPQSIIHAGGKPVFREIEWTGCYRLEPYAIYDSARWFTEYLFSIIALKNPMPSYVCCSFHWSKTLAIGQGGVILHNDDDADAWFRKMRFDGRTEGVAPKDDKDIILAYHAYMSPRDAADGLSRLAVLPKHNDPLPNDQYADLSTLEIFK